MTSLRKFRDILTGPQRRTAVGLLGLMLIGMMLETVSVGLILPAIALMTQPDLADGHWRLFSISWAPPRKRGLWSPA